MSEDGTGFYNDYIATVQQNTDGAFSYRPLPYQRAQRSFQEKEAACIFPSTTWLNSDEDAKGAKRDLIASAPFLRKNVFLFSQYGAEPIERLEQIAGARVGHAMGSAFPRLYPELNATYVPVADESTKALLLVRRRLDFIVGTMPDTVLAFRSLDQELPPHGPEGGFLTYYTGIVCHRSPAAEAMISVVNKALKNLRQNGELHTFLDTAGTTNTSAQLP